VRLHLYRRIEFLPENGGGAGVRLRKTAMGATPATIPIKDLNASSEE
jgi:hypothetical protein